MIDPSVMIDELPCSTLERCRYPSKFCRNRRSIKRNGELHRFCDYHRAKANQNQKRWSKNRRGRSCETESPPASPNSSLGEPKEPPRPDFPRFTANDHESAPFLSMLEMLQPQPFDGLVKPAIAGDEQLSVFLRELLLLPSPSPSPALAPRVNVLSRDAVEVAYIEL